MVDIIEREILEKENRDFLQIKSIPMLLGLYPFRECLHYYYRSRTGRLDKKWLSVNPYIWAGSVVTLRVNRPYEETPESSKNNFFVSTQTLFEYVSKEFDLVLPDVKEELSFIKSFTGDISEHCSQYGSLGDIKIYDYDSCLIWNGEAWEKTSSSISYIPDSERAFHALIPKYTYS